MISEAYLALVRTKPCALCGHAPPNDAHHLRNRGTYEHKRADETSCPTCRECHALIHSVGLARALEMRGVKIAHLIAIVTANIVEFFKRGTGDDLAI